MTNSSKYQPVAPSRSCRYAVARVIRGYLIFHSQISLVKGNDAFKHEEVVRIFLFSAKVCTTEATYPL